MEDVVDGCHHDDDLEHDSDDKHGHEDPTLEDARKDVVLIENLAGVDLVEHLHKDESIEEKTLAGGLILLLHVVVEAAWVVKRFENLQKGGRFRKGSERHGSHNPTEHNKLTSHAGGS